jgi:hypothetical protein
MREKVKLLLRNDLLSFARKTFKEKNNGRLMPEDRYLELLAGRLADVVVGDTKRLIVNLPPRHFKSWIGSVCLSAWILGHDPAAKILIVTYGQELADKIAHTVREILRSEWYKELFGKTKLVKSRSNRGLCHHCRWRRPLRVNRGRSHRARRRFHHHHLVRG